MWSNCMMSKTNATKIFLFHGTIGGYLIEKIYSNYNHVMY